MNMAMFALIHLCVQVNAKDRIVGQYKEHVFTGIVPFFVTFIFCYIHHMCMIEHQETRELMMNEDVDDEIAEVATAAAKGKKLKVRHRFRGNIVSACYYSRVVFVVAFGIRFDTRP